MNIALLILAAILGLFTAQVFSSNLHVKFEHPSSGQCDCQCKCMPSLQYALPVYGKNLTSSSPTASRSEGSTRTTYHGGTFTATSAPGHKTYSELPARWTGNSTANNVKATNTAVYGAEPSIIGPESPNIMNETDTTTIVFQLPNITWSSILPTSTNPTPEAGKPDDLYPGEIPGLNSTGPLIGNSTEASTGYKNLLLHAHSGNFFDQFDFFTGPDPTYGLVKYVDKSSASAKGLIGRIDRSVYIGVDSTSKLGASDTGRASVRLESKQRFTGGLFVLDVEHLPWGCGSWPAFWTFGAPWPFRGEVDIIEGVHLARGNSMVVHVASGDCSCQLKPFFTSDRGTRGIPYLANGCTPSKMSTETHLKDPRPNSYGGPGYKGGVYAMEWTKRDIKIWFFPRGTEPADLASTSTADANLEPVTAANAPNPNKWGHPVAWIPLLCGWGDRFKDHRVVINVSFCGAWAGKQEVWQASGCYHPQTAPTCEDWVRKRPETFKETYWKIRSVRVWAPKFPMGLGNDDAAAEGVSSGSGRNDTVPA